MHLSEAELAELAELRDLPVSNAGGAGGSRHRVTLASQPCVTTRLPPTAGGSTRPGEANDGPAPYGRTAGHPGRGGNRGDRRHLGLRGTGKTSTLRMIAERFPQKRMLYVAFNKAVQMEAAASFPGNVKCKTAHAPPTRGFAELKQRLAGPRRPSSYNATVLGARGLRAGVASFEPAAMATMAMTTVARFCRSAGPEVSAEHFTVPEGLDAACLGPLTEAVVALAKKAWQDLTSASGKLRAYHDVYLKHWQLSQPKLDYDVILYDEAQDADACVADVVGRQDHAQLVAVGDSAQALYCQPAETMVTVVRQRPTCGRGHSLTDPANLYTWRGKTSCRACRKEAMHIRREDYVGNPVTYTEAVPIEQVKAGDMVVSYDMAHSFLRRTGSRVSRNEQRDHPGPLVKVEVGAITTRYTPDHECIVRFGKAWAGKYVLYVMRRGNDYRVGISRARYASQQGRLGAIARAAGEKADALWVLAVYQDRTSACVAEATAAWKYRVPDLTFRAEQSVVVGLTQASLDDIWKVIGDNAVDASSLLTAFGRNLEYPLWERGQLMPAASSRHRHTGHQPPGRHGDAAGGQCL